MPDPAVQRRAIGRPAALIASALALVAATAAIGIWLSRPRVEPPPVLGELEPFALTDQHASPFGSEQLKGKVWIANFIFTRCPTVCPVFSQKMARIQERTRALAPRLLLVSFSVDPDYDTPERLLAYGQRFGADPSFWKFLTGAPEQVRLTVRDGLKIAMELEGVVGDVPDILHGTHFVLLDQHMRIRGYYSSNDALEIDRLVRDATQLVHHPD